MVRNGYHLVRCRGCGLVYVSPRPRSRESIDALYTDETYSTRQVSHALTTSRMREAEWRLDRLERHVGQRGRLLDVGCSAGSFLVAARDRGWQVRGIDISPAAVDHARDAHGLDTSVATLEESTFAPRSFDVVTLFECIEHMLDPRAALRSAASLLRDEGLLVITTPNVDGFVPRSTYLILGRTIGAWDHPTPPHHLYQFSCRTLTTLLNDVGFRVAACETRPMGLRYTVKQMQSAIIEALTRPFRRPELTDAADSGPAPRPVTTTPRRTPIVRRAARLTVGALCWVLGVALYAVPARLMGVGDSMIVIARKA